MDSLNHPLSSVFVRVGKITDANEPDFTSGAGFIVSENVICTCAHVIAIAFDDEDIKYNSEPPDGLVDVFFPFYDSMKVRCRVDRWAPIKHGQDAATLVPVDSIPIIKTPRPIIGADISSGDLFETCGFKTGTSFVAHVDVKIKHSLPFGWVELVGLNKLGLYVQKGFSGAPAWSVSHQAIIGMINAVDDSTKNSRVAYLIPSVRLEESLGLSLVGKTWGTITHFDKRRALSFIKSARISSAYAQGICDALFEHYLPIANVGERVWIYFVLGEIGGQVAETYLRFAMAKEETAFAMGHCSSALSRAIRRR